MHDPTDDVTRTQIREYQAQAVSLLDELLSSELPPVGWRIPDIALPELDGQLWGADRSYAEIRAELDQWSRFLGVPVTEAPVRRHPGNVILSVITTRDQITVKVWTIVNRPPAETPAAAEERAA